MLHPKSTTSGSGSLNLPIIMSVRWKHQLMKDLLHLLPETFTCYCSYVYTPLSQRETVNGHNGEMEQTTMLNRYTVHGIQVPLLLLTHIAVLLSATSPASEYQYI